MNSQNKSKIKNYEWVFAAFMLLILLLTLSFAFRKNELIVFYPLTEDGYYVLSVSRHIALGNGVSNDGVDPTNGFQPLWVFICAALYLFTGGDRVESLRYVLLLHWAIYVMSAFLVAKTAQVIFSGNDQEKKRKLFLITGLIYLAASYDYHFNGLETGMALFFYALSWNIFSRVKTINLVKSLWLGALLGFSILARIDVIFLIPGLILFFLLIPNCSLIKKIKYFLIICTVALLVAAPWFIYNIQSFGHMMPSSGAAQQKWEISQVRFNRAFVEIVHLFNPFRLPAFLNVSLKKSSFGMIAKVINLLFAGYLIYKNRTLISDHLRKNQNLFSLPNPFFRFAGCYLIFAVMLVMWYVFSSFAHYFYCRYFSPLVIFSVLFWSYFIINNLVVKLWHLKIILLTTIVVASEYALKIMMVSGIQLGILSVLGMIIISLIMIYRIFLLPLNMVEKSEKFALSFVRKPSVKIALSVLLCTVVTASPINKIIFDWTGVTKSHYFDHQLGLISEHVPPGDYVAAWQSGTIGYFRDRVVNLDGKVNWDAIKEQNNIGNYLNRRGIRWVCDWPYYNNKLDKGDQWKFVGAMGESHEPEYAFELYRKEAN